MGIRWDNIGSICFGVSMFLLMILSSQQIMENHEVKAAATSKQISITVCEMLILLINLGAIQNVPVETCRREKLFQCVRRWLLMQITLTCMCKAQSPEPQVGGRVGDAAQTKLYRVDGLVQELICKVKLQKQSQKTKSQHNDRQKAVRNTDDVFIRYFSRGLSSCVAVLTSSVWCSLLVERSL